jgi:O-antigen ligase
VLIVLIPLGLFRIWGERKTLLKVAAAVATTFIALGAMLTFSRGAALALAIVIVLMTLLRYIRPSQLLAVVLAAAVLFAAQPTYFERILTLAAIEGATGTAGATENEDASIRKRANETIAALLVFADHPVLGVGRGLFPVYYGDYADEVGIISESEGRQAHNLYTGMAAEVGIIGFLCFMGIFGVTLLDLERVRRRWKTLRPDVAQMATAFILAVLAYLTSGMFLHLAYERYLWILLALAASTAWIGLHMEEPAPVEEEPVPTERTARSRRRPARPAARVGRRPKPA